jgi:predicted SAM-dependent methyltransferase
MAIHVFEHLFRHEAVKALSHWRELLAPDGLLILEMPCLEKVLRNFKHRLSPQMTTWGLYGEQTEIANGNHAMQHLWCWSVIELREEMLRAGFIDVASEIPRFHKPDRDMRLVGRRP